jgi:hypothetical protein
MPQSPKRFECLPDNGGTWMVWDHETASAAKLDGSELRGRQKEKAEMACGILSRIFMNRMNAKAQRPDRNGAG